MQITGGAQYVTVESGQARPVGRAPAISELVRKRMEEVLVGQGGLQAVLEYIRGSRGKMLRPLLVALAQEVCGEEIDAHTVEIATGIELVHVASLVHDDIVDRSTLRRGRPSLQAKFGPNTAVLAGDFLFATAFSLFTAHNQTDVLSLLTATIREMCEGEIDQQLSSFAVSEDFYWWYIHRKTASLISASCKAGALLAEKTSPADELRLERFGTYLGYAFQLTDDLLDCCGDEEQLGKPAGVDQRELSWSLPLIRARQAQLLRGDWQSSPREQMRELLSRHGVLQQIASEACEFACRARNLLSAFPEGPARKQLIALTRFVVERSC